MLSGLSQYRAQNKDVLTGYMGRLNDEIDKAIREAYATGESEQEIELLKAIKKGYEAPKDGTNMQGRFFRNFLFPQDFFYPAVKNRSVCSGKCNSAFFINYFPKSVKISIV